MAYNKIKKTLTVLTFILGVLSFGALFFCISGGGVLNDDYLTLEKMKELEKENLLNNPPQHLSDNLKAQIKLWKNPVNLKEYIRQTEENLSTVELYCLRLSELFLISLILRIFSGIIFAKFSSLRLF